MNRNSCHLLWLGRMDYGEAWDLQKLLAAARADRRVPDLLLLLEHPPTYTLGRRGSEAHLLVSREKLAEQGVAVYQVDRGGDITYHGPGQLIGYPIVSLEGRKGGAGRYLRDLEETLIAALDTFGVNGGRLPGFTGVWVRSEKIAAIGVKINARRITGHGFALNVTTDLSYFAQIVPCGIQNKGVTTLARILGRPIGLEEVAEKVAEAFGEVFGLKMENDPAAAGIFLREAEPERMETN